jgi:hypothetical protein
MTRDRAVARAGADVGHADALGFGQVTASGFPGESAGLLNALLALAADRHRDAVLWLRPVGDAAAARARLRDRRRLRRVAAGHVAARRPAGGRRARARRARRPQRCWKSGDRPGTGTGGGRSGYRVAGTGTAQKSCAARRLPRVFGRQDRHGDEDPSGKSLRRRRLFRRGRTRYGCGCSAAVAPAMRSPRLARPVIVVASTSRSPFRKYYGGDVPPGAGHVRQARPGGAVPRLRAGVRTACERRRGGEAGRAPCVWEPDAGSAPPSSRLVAPFFAPLSGRREPTSRHRFFGAPSAAPGRVGITGTNGKTTWPGCWRRRCRARPALRPTWHARRGLRRATGGGE